MLWIRCSIIRLPLAALLWISLFAGTGLSTRASETPDPLNIAGLLQGVKPLISSLAGREQQFQLSGHVRFPIDGKTHEVEVRVTRFDNECFDLILTHQDYAVELRRRADVTALGLPKHATVFVGSGAVNAADQLSPLKLLDRLNSRASRLSEATTIVNLLAIGDLEAIVRGYLPTAGVQYVAESKIWQIDGNTTLKVPAAGRVEVKSADIEVSLTTELSATEPVAVDEWPGMKVVELDRDELERTLLRGIRRTSEILQPSELLVSPSQQPRSVPNGQLLWKDGQRVALLKGTPEEIGKAHGELLPDESRRCIESVLYAFGTANVITTGRWFRHDLEAAYARLSPFIPDRHKAETRALASALHLEPQVVEVLNVFPELFHCSGFAVFGSATKDGRLYHGRVLDYMTAIGLQDAATTFVVTPDGHIPFANIGYAGFVGSVSGMNLESISLGEMGGRGEGNWDGVPMATLMRRALEECRTLDEVKSLWAENPRTCEYYYVFADGKANQAVGVAATPEKIEFIEPGQSHEQLGEGIRDTVVLSAGSRLQELRRRVTESHGQIDADVAQWLMSRPVAMQSNLHNVLFVPQDGIFYVANASHTKPAAETPYVRLDLRELVNLATQTGRPQPVGGP